MQQLYGPSILSSLSILLSGSQIYKLMDLHYYCVVYTLIDQMLLLIKLFYVVEYAT